MWKFLDERFEDVLGSLLLAVMAGIACINVAVRYCTSFSFAWTEELTVNLFVWVVLLGTARVFREGRHLGMSVLYDALPRAVRRLCYWGTMALGVAFFAVLCWTGFMEVLDEHELEAISEALGIPVWWYTLATPLFSLLTVVRMLQRAWADRRGGRL